MNVQLLVILAIAACILAALGVAIVLGMTRNRKPVLQGQQNSDTSGFTRLAPAPEITERLLPLHQKGYHKILEIRNLHQQRHGACTLYLYDVWDVSDAAHDLDSRAVIALVAPGLDLPHFLLFPKANTVGWTATMANEFNETLIGLHARVINFDERPNFNQRYLVSGDDEQAVRRCLTSPVLAALIQTPLKNLIISAWGDALMVMTENDATPAEDPAASVRARREMALILYERMATQQ